MGKYIVIGVLVVFILLVLWVIITYNKLVQLRNKVEDGGSQVDIQLKKRFDLIPNIVETVKGYAKHEKETLTDVIEARNSAINARTLSDEVDANNELSDALTRLFALSESYPELKADENFKNLQTNLKEIEDKIAYARQFYNDIVLKYKDAIMSFPTVLIAGMLGFKQTNFFEIESEERDNVKVKF